MRHSTHFTSLIFCGLLPSLLAAGELPDNFTLGRYVPGDVWFYVHVVRNPERAWLDKEWAEVLDALKVSGIDRDIISLIMSAVGDQERAEAETTLEKWTSLIKGVRWSDLAAEEFAFAERLAKGSFGPGYLALVRGKPGTAEANMAGLVAIVKEVASLSEKIQLAEHDVSGMTVWSMGPREPKTPKLAPRMRLFRKGDIIGLAFGLDPFTDVIRLMTGKGDRPAFVAMPRFRKALTEVKTPEDSVMFVDVKQVFRDIAGLMQLRSDAPMTSGDEDAAKWVNMARKVMDICDVMDYTIVTMETEGRRELTHTVARLQQDKQKCALACACFRRKPFKRFDEFVPVDATGFSLTGFIDLEYLYKLVIDFIEQDVPDGPKHITKWNGLLASIGFDPQRDLFSWWSGEMISVTLPAAVVTPMSKADWVLMFRIKNSELASQKVNAAVDFVSGKAQAEGQMLMVTPAAVNAEGFRQLTHPMLAMFLRPVIGVKDEWLTIGSSAGVINKCLEVAAGKAPSIVKSERFKKEGLIPKGPVLSCSFKDTSKLGEELGMAFGMAGMVGGMMSGLIQGPDADEGKQVLQKLMTITMKLGPVLQKIDFYSSESSMTTYDDALTVRTEKVVTYKPPSAPDVKTAGVK